MITVLVYLATTSITLLAVSRRAELSRAAALILIALPLTLTGRALLQGDVYGPLDLSYTAEPFASIAAVAKAPPVSNPAVSDVYTEFFPWDEAQRFAISHGEWPHWNHFVLSGTPLAASVQTALYHPITTIRHFVPVIEGIVLAASLAYFLAALCAFLLALELTRDQWAALVAAAAWMYCTTIIFFAGTALALSVAVMPLVLLAARRTAIAPGPRTAGLLLLSLTLLVTGGHPESTLHVVTLAIAFFLFTLAGVRGIEWKRVLATGIGAGVATLLLCAIYLLPFIEVTRQSEEYRFRAEGYSDLRLSSTAPQLAHRIRANFFPFLEGAEGVEYALHSPETKHGWIGNFYPGWLVIGLALAGLLMSRARERWFMLGAGVFGIAFAAGTPGLVEFVQKLPLFSISVNDRMVSYASLAAAMLAAFATKEILDTPRRALAPLAIAAAAVVIAAIALPTDLPRDFVTTGAARALIPLLLALAALLLLAPRHVAQLLLVLVICQRVAEASWMQPTVPREAFYPPFPGAEILATAGPSRVVGVGNMLVPNLSTHYGLEDVRGFEALTLARYHDTIPLWSVRQPVWSNRVDRLEAPFLSALNVRFALTPPTFALPDGWVERLRTPGYVIAENTRVLPRAWIPQKIMFASGKGTIAGMAETRDFGEEGWIERIPAGDGGPNGRGSVEASRSGSGLRLRANIETTAWVFVSNAAWDGWRATENGREIPLHVANNTMLAMQLVPGTHDIELKFVPRTFAAGAATSVITLLAIAGIAIRSRFRAPS